MTTQTLNNNNNKSRWRRRGHRWNVASIFLVLMLALFSVSTVVDATYRIGVGRADCTGPPVEIGFMGYAEFSQRGHGIHLRQFSRAFIFEDEHEERVVFVSADAGMMGHAVKRDVVDLLQKRYGDVYRMDNVVMSGTHSHSVPSGFLMSFLYDIASLGFVPQNFNALVEGIALSIVRAHEGMRDGRIFVSEIEVKEANINRSPSAYENNPKEERARYKDYTDKKLVQLRFEDPGTGEIFGAVNWFAIHPTSMNKTNCYVSSDNVGYASILIEQEMDPGSLPGKGAFVGAVAASNLGDVSPNIMGPKCQRSGLPCDLLTSSCPSGQGLCIASGPGKDMFESTRIIGRRIHAAASELLKSRGGREIRGPIGYAHQFIDMTKTEVPYFNRTSGQTESVRGCFPAMGYSFAAGTTDGPGAFDFRQAMLKDTAFWNAARDFIAVPTDEDIACHAPKPILIASGRTTFSYETQPKIVPVQVLQVGSFVIAAVPAEFTTMSGRRLREAIEETSLQAGGKRVQVVIAGLSNMYTSYVATPEEYAIQRYEGASTLYGPHTLTIYLHHFRKLMEAIVSGVKLPDEGPEPPFEDYKQITLSTGVVFDGHPFRMYFGDIQEQPKEIYEKGDTVKAVFVAGNPRNNLMHEKSYFTVEKLDDQGQWKVVANDASWETKFRWIRKSTLVAYSDVEFEWETGPETEEGTYRIQHFGYWRYILGGTYPYNGTTRNFSIL
ncbi:neutral ceramidase-like [Uranotaenia lowii]|uniref:neutral ceramidase-like n=1 Tax=Uranotaenia lowii TaxID=190385 RepID=UPI002479F09C|nr:neutral ceramidase-like [Uranotaenia lowii]XP_055586439.1 neutral ceramidase-like [Uranotaenia lowii]XP_055586440.1 neutral ceramidase-like [Uranotaenia lowii]